MDIELDTDDAFAQAFGEAETGNPAPAAQTTGDTELPAGTEATPPATTEAAAPATEATKPTEALPPQEATPPATEAAAPAAEATPPAAQTPPATPPAAQTPPATQDPLAGIDPKFLAQALAEENERRAREAAQQQPPEPAKPFTAEDFMDDNAKASLAKFKTDWPDEFPAIQTMIQAQAQALVNNQINALIADINKVLAPITQSLGQSEVNAHWSAIRSAHPDFDSVLEPMKAWVAQQPELFRPQMEQILAKGNAQQVIQLAKMYKDATVQTGAAPTPPASSATQEQQPAVVTPKAPVNPAAVAATAAVPATQRTKQQQGVDPNDFEGAFAEALSAQAS